MNKIFYFSGTGNTLAAARKVAELLGDTELISITDLQRGDDVSFEGAERVGIFFPVYCFGVPNLVIQFIKRIKKLGKKGNEQPYLFTFCTSGGMLGSAHLIAEQHLSKRNYRLNAYFHVAMPSNYIPLSNGPSPGRIAKTLTRAETKIGKIVTSIEAKKKRRPIHVFPLDLWGELVANRAVSMLGDYDKYFWLNENCDNCGVCQKICPASNIIIMNGMPTWRGHCEQCMACLQWCPKQAIQFKQVTQKRRRYHHPDVTAEDLYRKNR